MKYIKKIYKNIRHFFHLLKLSHLNRHGVKTNRHIVVFESDDWGSIRTDINFIEKNNFKDAFLRFDCLESEGDLIELFNILKKYKDSKGNYPKITFNFALANVDFDESKIKDGKLVYKNEPFIETYQKYYGNKNVFDLLKMGIKEKLIVPQLHCLEHLNVQRWVKDIDIGKVDTYNAFLYRMYGVDESFSSENQFGYMDAFNYDNAEELELISENINKACNMFENIFCFSSKSVVAPCFVWDEKIEKIFYENGIKIIQTQWFQNIPIKGYQGTSKFKKKKHFSGSRNTFGQFYNHRNCSYEPILSSPYLAYCKCIEEIENAFSHHTIATINCHRANFIRTFQLEQANLNLIYFEKIIQYLVEKFPDIEFLSTDELIEVFND